MHARSGRSHSNSAGSPPTMMLSVPSRAACAVRAIGASAKEAPRDAKAWPSSRASATGQVLMSTTVWPGFTRAASPPSRQTARTCGSPGRHRNTISARLASSATEAAACTPSAASAASGAGRSSKASTVAPDFLARFRHIGWPMTPSPMNPSTPGLVMPASLCREFEKPSKSLRPYHTEQDVRPLLDDVVRAPHERRLEGKAERLGRFHVDHELEFRGLLDGQLAGLGALEDLVDIRRRAPEALVRRRPVARQAA